MTMDSVTRLTGVTLSPPSSRSTSTASASAAGGLTPPSDRGPRERIVVYELDQLGKSSHGGGSTAHGTTSREGSTHGGTLTAAPPSAGHAPGLSLRGGMGRGGRGASGRAWPPVIPEPG